MFSEKNVVSGVPLVVDVTGRGITEVSQIPGGDREVAALTADNNRLASLKGIHTFSPLIQFSACSNCLVSISAVSSLPRLVTLNLQNNSITTIEGLDSLTQLEWLGLAGNSIKIMSGLSGNTKLAHLDLSDNCITEVGNVSMLRSLKTLLLHGNAITHLKSVPDCFPASLTTLSLAENHVQDLNEISFLSVLPELSEVSVMGNPCVSLTHQSTLFDYRPYIVYWCPAVSSLDGISITAEEKLRSVSLFHSNHTYPFRLGQHQDLVQYLTTTCPLPVLENQLYALPDQSVPFDPSSQVLLTQALSLENPQQKAEVMQKIRVLQVLEQVISQQENLLNEQQQHSSRKPEPFTDASTSETTAKYEIKKSGNVIRAASPCDQEVGDILSRGESSLADTTLTGGESVRSGRSEGVESGDMREGVMSGRSEGVESGDMREGVMSGRSEGVESGDMREGVMSGRSEGVESGDMRDGMMSGRSERVESGDTREGVMSEEVERVESDVIRPEPSFPFNIVDGSGRYSMKTGHQTVRIAWAEKEDIVAPPRGGRGHEGGEGGGDGGDPEQVEGTDEPDFDNLASVSLSQSSHSLQSNAMSGHPLPPTTVGSTTTPESDLTIVTLENETSGMSNTTLGNEISGMDNVTLGNEVYGMGNVTLGNEISGMGNVTLGNAISGMGNVTLGNEISGMGNVTLGNEIPGIEPDNSVSGESITASKNKLSHSNHTLENILPPASTPATNTAMTATCTDSLSTDSSSEIITMSASQSAPVADSSTEMTALHKETNCETSEDIIRRYSDIPLQISSSVSSTLLPPAHQMVNRTSKDSVPLFTASDPSLEDTVDDCDSLEIKYSSPVGLPDFLHTKTSLPASSVTETLEEGGEVGKMETRMDASVPVSSVTETLEEGGEVGEMETLMDGSVEKKDDRRETEEQSLIKGEMDCSEDHESTTDTLVCSNVLSQATVPPPSSLSQHDAAAIIQACVRGHLCRKIVSAYKTRLRAAITIQSIWRGYRSRRHDPVVISARQELSRKKMESYISTMYLQLKGCCEEMAHQAQVLQLQEETIASLIQEVEDLHAWRRGMKERAVEGAAATIQRYWRGCKTRKETVHRNVSRCQCNGGQQEHVESLRSLCRGLRQQVKDLEEKMVSLQEASTALPGPSDLSMCKHSLDTILLQWTAVSGGVHGSSLQGYRVYVNGVEEGMVGPTKHKAYIEGLDISSTYRISVRAVYDCGESRDSNMLLVASVNPHTEHTLTPHGPGKEVVCLPRSLRPPAPAQLPELVEKMSILSKSASCCTLGTMSIENSTATEPRSLSANELDKLSPISQSVLVPFVEQNRAKIHNQTDTSIVGESLITAQSTIDQNPPLHKVMLPESTGGKMPPNEETECDPSTRHDLHTPFREVATISTSCQATTTSEPCCAGTLSRGGMLGEVPHKQRCDGLDFTGEEIPREACALERFCGQTQPLLTLSMKEEDLKTDTIHRKSSQFDIPVMDNSAMRRNKTSLVSTSEPVRHVMRTASPGNNRKSTRLVAAKFDVPSQAESPSNDENSGTSQNQSPRPNNPHTTQLATRQSLMLHSDPPSSVSPTLSVRPDKDGALVGQTPSGGPGDVQIDRSERVQQGEGLAGENRATSQVNSGQKQHRRGMNTGMHGDDSQRSARLNELATETTPNRSQRVDSTGEAHEKSH